METKTLGVLSMIVNVYFSLIPYFLCEVTRGPTSSMATTMGATTWTARELSFMPFAYVLCAGPVCTHVHV